MINALTYCPTESAQGPCEMDTMAVPIVQMKKLKPGGLSGLNVAKEPVWQRQSSNHDNALRPGDSECCGNTEKHPPQIAVARVMRSLTPEAGPEPSPGEGRSSW